MFEVTQILFPTDLSIMCGAFAWQVTALATRLNANLTLLHVQDEEQEKTSKPRVSGQFSGFTNLIGEQMEPHRVSRKIISGGLAENIISEADSECADLIMIPAQEKRGWRRFLEAPMIEQTLRQSRCAVWTASTNRAAACAQFRNIVCAVDLHADSPRVLASAIHLANRLDATLSVVHVLPEADESLLHLAAMHDLPLTFSDEEIHGEIRRMQPDSQNSPEILIEHGDVSSGIRRALQRQNADLLVIGPGRFSEIPGGLGAHVVPLVRTASCPVLVLRKPESVGGFCLKKGSNVRNEAVEPVA